MVAMLDSYRPLPPKSEGFTAPDAITLTGYGLGLWWALGGPTWAGLASIVADEMDGRVARTMQHCTPHGSALDWGADVTLTPFALGRLSQELGYGYSGVAAAPLALYAQAQMRGDGWRPPVGYSCCKIALITC